MRASFLTLAWLIQNLKQIKNPLIFFSGFLAGETRLEHATDGFGDRNSTIELLP